MASSGCKWFMLDTRCDEKVELMIAKPDLGIKAFAVWVMLLQRIYGMEGYYCIWNSDICTLFARDASVNGVFVSRVIEYCLDSGLFDRTQFERNGILTSSSIQKRFLQYKSRATSVEMEGCFLCDNLDKNVYRNLKSVYRIGKNVCNSSTTIFDSTLLDSTISDSTGLSETPAENTIENGSWDEVYQLLSEIGHGSINPDDLRRFTISGLDSHDVCSALREAISKNMGSEYALSLIASGKHLQ
ncbi:MAG: DUF4373 domain-containing protein [Prevotella sp.]|jgi:hypothetical protein|nr:DUF4373 domain-containing protein [Prevotella sp.]MCH4182967.1 DUF4373 domain-containing protein [Prevotella sp.]